MTKQKEQWKDLCKLADVYQVSSLGRCTDKKKGNYKLSHISKSDYKVFYFTHKKQKYTFQVHRLIAQHFIPNEHKYKYVRHIDSNKLNNQITNLEWTCSNNYSNRKRKTKKHKIDKSIIIIDNNKKWEKYDLIDKELWKCIDGHDSYIISTQGRIMNINTGNIKKPQLTNKYLMISLYNKNLNKSNKYKIYYVHRLVAQTFLNNTNNYNIVDHINCIKTDNREINLRYVTSKQNTQYYYKNNKKGKYKPVLQYNKNGKFIKEWYNITEIFNNHKNYYKENIYRVLNGVYKTQYGYIWKYKYPRNNKIVIFDDEVFKNIGNIDSYDFSNYLVSNYGKIKSLFTNEYLNRKKTNYVKVSLRDNISNTRKSMYIHRLVALLFVDGRSVNKNVVNHLDRNPQNNYYKNLEWTSYRGNAIHAMGKKINQIETETN